MEKTFYLGNKLVIIITFILFAIALFTTGFTKDLLLEAAVLLVSIKIIMINHVNSNSNKEIINKLDEIKEKLDLFNSKYQEK